MMVYNEGMSETATRTQSTMQDLSHMDTISTGGDHPSGPDVVRVGIRVAQVFYDKIDAPEENGFRTWDRYKIVVAGNVATWYHLDRNAHTVNV